MRFCICWQHAGDEQLPGWLTGEQFTVIDVPWQHSRGACWARSVIMDLWDGEDWYLQLDSHHRFAPGWDTRLLEQAAATGSPKPIVSTYAPPFAPGVDEEPPLRATEMVFDRFTEDGDYLTRPRVSDDGSSNRPVRARFISAHFLLAPGRFVDDVPYDPDLYFTGEETTLTIRAFTHGYDLFRPGVPIVSHEYTRDYRSKHWDNHLRSQGVPVEWHERDAMSRAKIRGFLAAPTIGYYGLGSERTLADYEAYAGISFTHRRVQDYTMQHLEPPNPPADLGWLEGPAS